MIHKQLTKISGILFFISLVIILSSWLLIYPIELPSVDNITFNQFSYILWIGVSINLLSVFFIAFYCRKKIIRIICSMFIPLLIYIYVYFFKYIPSSDSGNILGMIRVFENVGSNPNLVSYFEFPTFFNLNIIFKNVTNFDYADLSIISFAYYGIFLSLFLYMLFHRLLDEDNSFHPFLLVIIYFVGIFPFLNYQWVPQTLALVYFLIMTYILVIYLHSKSFKIEYRIILFLIYIPFLYSHAIIPILFLFAIGFFSLKNKVTWLPFIVLSSFTIAFIIYNTTFHFQTYVDTLMNSFTSVNNEYSTFVSRSTIVKIDVMDQIISYMNTVNIFLIWSISLLGSLIFFLKKKMNYLFISLGIISGIYVFIGIVMSVLGLRGLQLLFIPASTGFLYFFNKWKKVIIIIILVILVLSSFSPMRMAYNQTHFQLDSEINVCNQLASIDQSEQIVNMGIGQVNWGYLTNIYILYNEKPVNAIRPGNNEFLNLINTSLNSDEIIVYNSNLGKEILKFGLFDRASLINYQYTLIDNKIIDVGSTFVIKGY